MRAHALGEVIWGALPASRRDSEKARNAASTSPPSASGIPTCVSHTQELRTETATSGHRHTQPQGNQGETNRTTA